MLVLLTRPRDQAERTALALRAIGHDVLIDPLLEISPLAAPTVVPGEVAAAAITSANAVQAVAALPRDLPVFVVGQATAAAVRRAGREPTLVAGGDGRDLAALHRRDDPGRRRRAASLRSRCARRPGGRSHCRRLRLSAGGGLRGDRSRRAAPCRLLPRSASTGWMPSCSTHRVRLPCSGRWSGRPDSNSSSRP